MAKDLSHLPRAAASTTDGEPPVRSPLFGQLLAEKWMAAGSDRGDYRMDRGYVWHSRGGDCSMRIGLDLLGVEGTPMDMTGWWNTGIGKIIHDEWQAAMRGVFGDAVAFEVPVFHEAGGRKVSSGRIDALVLLTGPLLEWFIEELENNGVDVYLKRRDAALVAIEAKSIGGFGFKTHVGAQNKNAAAEGPNWSARYQGALGGLAVDADYVVVLDIAKEVISPGMARLAGITTTEGRFIGEWYYGRDQYVRWAESEVERFAAILNRLDDGRLPPRREPQMPKGAVITAPSKGTWVLTHMADADDDPVVIDSGSTWLCGYCPQQATCSALRSNESVANVRRIQEQAA